MSRDATQDKLHWDEIYRSRPPQALSWTQGQPGVVSRWLETLPPAPDPSERLGAVLEVGGGHSSLVGALLEQGWGPVTVLDLSEVALEQAHKRLGAMGDLGDAVRWQVADITTAALEEGGYRLWHDRATFHFLTDAPSRDRYVEQVLSHVLPGGHLMLSTFAPDGPEQCSGLPVRRYGALELLALFAPHFRLRVEARELHHTPWGAVQPFTCVWLERAR